MVRCCRRCGVAGCEGVPPALLGWYFFSYQTSLFLAATSSSRSDVVTSSVCLLVPPHLTCTTKYLPVPNGAKQVQSAPSRHILDTFKTPSSHPPDTFQMPSRHPPYEALHTPKMGFDQNEQEHPLTGRNLYQKVS